jgi:hypothetical protein
MKPGTSLLPFRPFGRNYDFSGSAVVVVPVSPPPPHANAGIAAAHNTTTINIIAATIFTEFDIGTPYLFILDLLCL